MAIASSLNQLVTEDRPDAQRLREALALFEDGVEMKRRNLKRQFPEASEADLHVKLLSWLARQDES